MRKYRYTTTNCFKPGEQVWITGLKILPSGRIKYIIKPTFCKIIGVSERKIQVDTSNLSYYAPSFYCLDSPVRYTGSQDLEYSLNLNVAKTKEEALENFNQRITEEIEYRYQSFRNLEARLKQYLL